MTIPMKRKGFIDLHTHGFGKYDTRTNDPDDILGIAELHGKAGTAAILPAIYSGTIDKMRKNIEAVRRAMEVQKAKGKRQKAKGKNFTLSLTLPPRGGGQGWGGVSSLITEPALSLSKGHSALILGVHLEGPFLNPARSGALDKDAFLKPTLASLERLIHGFEEIIRIITIAPELPGALKVIEFCAGAGIRVNMGHSDATYGEAVDGKKAGATGVTHIFNAMRPFHHREPGLAGFGLLDEDTFIEVIADGVHLHTETLRLIFRTKRHDRIILVSDSVEGAMPGGKPVYRAKGVLAGSGMSLADAAGVLKNLGISRDAAAAAGLENPKKYLSGQ